MISDWTFLALMLMCLDCPLLVVFLVISRFLFYCVMLYNTFGQVSSDYFKLLFSIWVFNIAFSSLDLWFEKFHGTIHLFICYSFVFAR